MIYKLGHIYVIWDIEDHNLTYYGSTKDIKERICQHKCPSNSCTSKKIIERGNYEIAILETYENIDEYDLVERERWYIENKPCVNQVVPHRTLTEYYQNNKKKIAEQKKIYYQDIIKNKMKKRYVCECGGKFTYGTKSRHEKSKKHQRYINITNQLH
jgi:predicted GIY-YIG superfamily endonuclease